MEDSLWCLGRHISVESNMRVSPGWTGFYYLLSRDVPTHDTHSITYLPTINNPATEMGTVMEVLRQVFHRSRVLGLTNAGLVLDHAIYAKALKIIFHPNNQDLMSTINLRMDGFHTISILLAVICKRFGDGGLYNLIVEAHIISSTTTERVLKDKLWHQGDQISL